MMVGNALEGEDEVAAAWGGPTGNHIDFSSLHGGGGLPGGGSGMQARIRREPASHIFYPMLQTTMKKRLLVLILLPCRPACLQQLPDDCDSNMARAIQASRDDARVQQQQQRGGDAAAAGVGEAALDSSATAAAAAVSNVDPSRPSDADIIAFENQIRYGMAMAMLLREMHEHISSAEAVCRSHQGGCTLCLHTCVCVCVSREGEAKKLALVGDREELAALAAEYAEGSAVYRQKIASLAEEYGSIRWVGGMGWGGRMPERIEWFDDRLGRQLCCCCAELLQRCNALFSQSPSPLVPHVQAHAR